MSRNSTIVLGVLWVASCAAAFAIGFLSRPTYRVASLEQLRENDTGKLYDELRRHDRLVGEVDVRELVGLMRNSEWTNQQFNRKGSWNIELSNGTQICLSYYGDFFEIGGVPGVFLIPEINRRAFGEYISSRLAKPTIEWRLRNPNRSEAPIFLEREEAFCVGDA